MQKPDSKKKHGNISALLYLCLILFLIAGCGMGSSGGGGDGDTTNISVNLNVPSAANAASSDFYALAVPLDVSSMVIIISADQMTTITDTFNVSPGDTVERIYNVPSGPDRTIAAEAYSGTMGSGDILYRGEDTRTLDGVDTEVDLNMEQVL